MIPVEPGTREGHTKKLNRISKIFHFVKMSLFLLFLSFFFFWLFLMVVAVYRLWMCTGAGVSITGNTIFVYPKMIFNSHSHSRTENVVEVVKKKKKQEKKKENIMFGLPVRWLDLMCVYLFMFVHVSILHAKRTELLHGIHTFQAQSIFQRDLIFIFSLHGILHKQEQ